MIGINPLPNTKEFKRSIAEITNANVAIVYGLENNTMLVNMAVFRVMNHQIVSSFLACKWSDLLVHQDEIKLAICKDFLKKLKEM